MQELPTLSPTPIAELSPDEVAQQAAQLLANSSDPAAS